MSYLFHIVSISLEGLVYWYVPTRIFPTSSARSLLHGPLSDINHDYALHYQLDGSKRLDRVVKWLAVCVLSVMLACESEGSKTSLSTGGPPKRGPIRMMASSAEEVSPID